MSETPPGWAGPNELRRHLRVYNESGSGLGNFDLGNDADEGPVEGHTYYSPNGYSY